jgi:hypothetical protein
VQIFRAKIPPRGCALVGMTSWSPRPANVPQGISINLKIFIKRRKYSTKPSKISLEILREHRKKKNNFKKRCFYFNGHLTVIPNLKTIKKNHSLKFPQKMNKIFKIIPFLLQNHKNP